VTLQQQTIIKTHRALHPKENLNKPQLQISKPMPLFHGAQKAYLLFETAFVEVSSIQFLMEIRQL
jgi:hypothetical protein